MLREGLVEQIKGFMIVYVVYLLEIEFELGVHFLFLHYLTFTKGGVGFVEVRSKL